MHLIRHKTEFPAGVMSKPEKGWPTHRRLSLVDVDLIELQATAARFAVFDYVVRIQWRAEWLEAFQVWRIGFNVPRGRAWEIKVERDFYTIRRAAKLAHRGRINLPHNWKPREQWKPAGDWRKRKKDAESG